MGYEGINVGFHPLPFRAVSTTKAEKCLKVEFPFFNIPKARRKKVLCGN